MVSSGSIANPSLRKGSAFTMDVRKALYPVRTSLSRNPEKRFASQVSQRFATECQKYRTIHQGFHQPHKIPRMVFQIGVLNHTKLAPRLLNSGADGSPFSPVLPSPNQADRTPMPPQHAFHDLG